MANVTNAAPLLHSESARTVPAAMGEIVAQIPDQVAVDDGSDQITYSE